MSDRILKSLSAAAVVVSLALGGCVVTPVGPDAYVGTAVTLEPPPLRTEVIGVAPGPGYIWTGGYWGWAGARYQWTTGHWLRARPGYYWTRSHWVRGAGGWRRAQGHWQRR